MSLTPLSSPPLSLMRLRECPHCGMFSSLSRPHPGFDMRCPRCGKTLRRARQQSMTWRLACSVSGLIFYLIVLATPLLQVSLFDRYRFSNILSGLHYLGAQGMPLLAIIVFMTVVAVPFAKLAGLLTVFGGLHLPCPPRWLPKLFRRLKGLHAWSMMEIYLIGFIVAYTRLQALTHVYLQVAVFALIGLVLSMVIVDATIDAEAVWMVMARRKLVPVPAPAPASVAHHKWRLVGCRNCHQANDAHFHSCQRCGSELEIRKPDSVRRTFALMLAALILYVPANLLPVMSMIKVGKAYSYTIMGGVLEFIHVGLWPLALLVFTVSIAVPMVKLVLLADMLWQSWRGSGKLLVMRTRSYRFIDFIGRWSMIDIFMISILVGLMQFGSLGEVTAGPGSIYFAGVVVLTMLAVESFDPRLMWDLAKTNEPIK